MTAPDPNGCKRCGGVECPARDELYHVGPHDFLHWSIMELKAGNGCAACDAEVDCLTRPAVDWQAECRRLASRPAPVEVRGVVTAVHESMACVREWLPSGPNRLGRAIDLPPWPTARVGQRVTVTVTPDEEG